MRKNSQNYRVFANNSKLNEEKARLDEKRTKLADERTRLDEQRTKLANERTSLAYVRTALSFIGAGILMIKFFADTLSRYISFAFIGFGVFLMIIGVSVFPLRNKKIMAIRSRLNFYHIFSKALR